MGGPQPKICIVELHAKTTNSASVLPHRDYGRTELGIPPTASVCGIHIESGSLRDTPLQGLWEVRRKDLAGECDVQVPELLRQRVRLCHGQEISGQLIRMYELEAPKH